MASRLLRGVCEDPFPFPPELVRNLFDPLLDSFLIEPEQLDELFPVLTRVSSRSSMEQSLEEFPTLDFSTCSTFPLEFFSTLITESCESTLELTNRSLFEFLGPLDD